MLHFLYFTVKLLWYFFLDNLDMEIPLKSLAPFFQFSHSSTLWPHGLQHTRLPCPSPTPWVYSNSCPLSRRFHPTISSSVVSFSSCLQFFPASGSFQMSQFFTSGGQSIGVSAIVLPMNIQDWSFLSRINQFYCWEKKKKIVSLVVQVLHVN